MIKRGFSPDAITGRLKRSGQWTVSTATLYDYIEKQYLPGISNGNLLIKSKEKKPKAPKRPARRPAGTSIEDRPRDVLTRSSFGHWELDSVIGKAKGKRESLLVMTERKSRFQLMLHVPSKSSATTVKALHKLISSFKPGTFKTITCDNGSEFSNANGMEFAPTGERQTSVYYCHPFASCERGSNENANRIIRRFFPKSKSLVKVTHRQVQAVQNWINDLPRRILGYATAREVFDAWQATL